MAAASVSCRTISVEHVTIGCSLAFDAVQTKLEAQLPWLDHTILQCVQEGDVEGALRLMEDAPPLSIFSARDHGGLLAIAGLHRRAVQYEIGNPLTATKMTLSGFPRPSMRRCACCCAKTVGAKWHSNMIAPHLHSVSSRTARSTLWRRS